MQHHPFETLNIDNGAQLLFTPCPGTKEESLEGSIGTLKAAGTKVLITLMFEHEMTQNNVEQLPVICQRNDITWFQLPILDDHAPSNDFEHAWQQHKDEILAVIKAAGTVAVHCKGGTGRTGLVIALILSELGWPKDKIIEEIHKVKTKSMRIPLQVEYFNAYHC